MHLEDEEPFQHLNKEVLLLLTEGKKISSMQQPRGLAASVAENALGSLKVNIVKGNVPEGTRKRDSQRSP
jgi:hypothetical protein